MSLLDSFSNIETTATTKQSICRNLEMVLDSRRAIFDLPEHSSHLQASLYGYGLKSLHDCRHSARVSDIVIDLEQTIQRFEPRLEQVVIELNRIDEHKNALSFHIEAVIKGEDGEPESFDTTINLTNATLMIEEDRHV